jgi:hypothetical protein
MKRARELKICPPSARITKYFLFKILCALLPHSSYLSSLTWSQRLNCINKTESLCYPRVVTGEKNSPPVAHACRKRRLKGVIGVWG